MKYNRRHRNTEDFSLNSSAAMRTHRRDQGKRFPVKLSSTTWVCLFVAVALCLPSAAVGAEEEQIELKVDWYTATPYRVQQQAENRVFELYMQEHPHVKIQPFTQLHVEGAAAQSGKLMSVAGGTPPDIWRMWFHETLKYANQGFVLELNDYIGHDENGDGRVTGDEVKYEPWNDIPTAFKVGCMQNGKIYALPYDKGIFHVLCYRADLFRQSNLDPNKPPATWDELYRYAQKLTFKAGEIAGLEEEQRGLSFMDWGYLCFNPLVWSAGGDLVHKYKINPRTGDVTEEIINTCSATGDDLRDVRTRWKATFDTPEALNAMRFLHRLRWQKWTKCPETREPFDLTAEMLEKGEAVSPYTGETFELVEGPRGNIYTGVLFVASGTEKAQGRPKLPVVADGRVGMFIGR